MHNTHAVTMPSNVEIKARLAGREQAIQAAGRLSGSTGVTLEQEDTFFVVPNGRLKLRVQPGCPGQLISYSRDDITGPKLSKYSIAEIEDPVALKTVLAEALGILGYVKKTRLLFLVGQTRVHIDHVQDLGDFLELEVMLQEGQTSSEGQHIAEELMSKLGVAEQDLVSGAYMDLILQN